MAIVRLVTENRMVTKGYRRGVYDRVTEGPSVPGPGWESRHQSSRKVVGRRNNSGMDRGVSAVSSNSSRAATVRNGTKPLSARDGSQHKDDKSEKGWPRKTPYDVPNHDAHRSNSPRGGVRE